MTVSLKTKISFRFEFESFGDLGLFEAREPFYAWFSTLGDHLTSASLILLLNNEASQMLDIT